MLYGEEHVRKYRETDGTEGHDWNGTQVLIVTTTGRKSGHSRDNALIYGMSAAENPVIVASKGGNPVHPDWYFNLTENPEVEVQIWGDRFPARARTASGQERTELWAEMLKHWPQYDRYQAETDREIPVVVLERL